jgi:hypothetical protein
MFFLKRGEVISPISDTRSHAGGPLHQGTMEDNMGRNYQGDGIDPKWPTLT